MRHQEYILRFSHFTVRISAVRTTLYLYLFLPYFWLHQVLAVALGTLFAVWGIFRLGLLSCCGAWAELPWGMCDLCSLTRDWTCVPCIGRRILNHWTTREVPVIYLWKHGMDKFLTEEPVDPKTYAVSSINLAQPNDRWRAMLPRSAATSHPDNWQGRGPLLCTDYLWKWWPVSVKWMLGKC